MSELSTQYSQGALVKRKKKGGGVGIETIGFGTSVKGGVGEDRERERIMERILGQNLCVHVSCTHAKVVTFAVNHQHS